MKPEYDAGKNLKEQMDAAVTLYNSEMSLQAIGDELGLNPIKVRKLLITTGVYESEVAEKVKNTFEECGTCSTMPTAGTFPSKSRASLRSSGNAVILWEVLQPMDTRKTLIITPS